MGGVHLVLAVYPTRRDHPDRDAIGLHGPNLHGGGLSPEQSFRVRVQIERVGPLPGRVVVGGIELGEVVVGLLHLGTIHDLKAHVDKNFFDLVQHAVHRVLVADFNFPAGDSDIHCLQLELGLHGLLGENGGLRLHGLFHVGADLVGHLPHHGAQLGRESTHLFENSGQLSLFAQVFDPQRLQLGGLPSSGDGFQRMLANGFQLFLHIKSSFTWMWINKLYRGKTKSPPSLYLGTKGFASAVPPKFTESPVHLQPR